MTIVYALKDTLSGEYLAKDDILRKLSTTTRLFQKRDKAHEIANDITTYFRIAVRYLTFGQRNMRINIIDPDFKRFYYEWKFNRPLEVVEVDIKELLINKN